MCNITSSNKKELEKVKAGLQPSGRRVVDFLADTYPERLPEWMSSGELTKIAECRQEEATEVMLRMEKEYLKLHKSDDYLTNLQYHYEARAIAQEHVNQILFEEL